MDNLEYGFLKILNLLSEKPTLEFLGRLLKQHQRYVPYENISKLIRKKEGHFTLPTFAEYLNDIKAFGYGGTCFTQNIYFNQLLQFLEFETTMLGHWNGDKLTHPSLVVQIENKNYFVDLGIMSSYVGPILLQPGKTDISTVGNQTYHLTAAEDKMSSNLQIFRHGKMIREHKNSFPSPTAEQLTQGVLDTFEKSEMFMTNLVAHKVFGDFSLGIWNSSFYRDQGETHEVTPLHDLSELIAAFEQLEMPKAQFHEALAILADANVKIF